MCNERLYVLFNMLFPLPASALLLLIFLQIPKGSHLWIACLVCLIIAVVAAIGSCLFGLCAICTAFDSYDHGIIKEMGRDIESGAYDGLDVVANGGNVLLHFCNFVCSCSLLVISALAYHNVPHSHYLFIGGVAYGVVFICFSVVGCIGACYYLWKPKDEW